MQANHQTCPQSFLSLNRLHTYERGTVYFYCNNFHCVEGLVLSKLSSSRIMEWFGLKVTFKVHPVPASLSLAGTPSTRPQAQSPVQPGFDHLQGLDIQDLSGQPVPVSHHPQSKGILPNI